MRVRILGPLLLLAPACALALGPYTARPVSLRQDGAATAEWVAEIKQAGYGLLVYTVNESAEAQRLLTLGIAGIITDAVDRFSPGDSLRD